MPCESVNIGGVQAIVCSRGRTVRCCNCRAPSKYQCDWKVEGGTCDRHICAEHAKEVAENKHLCPEHQAAYQDWLAKQKIKGARA